MPRLSPARQDLVCIAVLAIACLALWVPSLGAISLNPDESQYEATASYLVAEGESAFLPNGAPGTFLLFKTMTWLAGPYPIFAMRVLLQLVALGIALLLYRAVGRVTHRACGLLSGLVFLHLVTRFEGFAVNREWFASFVTMAGLGLYLEHAGRESRRRAWWLGLAGFLCGVALWFKLQVSFIVFVAPLALALDALTRRSLARVFPTLLPFALGGIAAGVVYLIPFAVQGTLSQFLGFVFSDVDVFVEGNEQAVRHDYLERFYTGLPYRPLFLVAYVFAAGTLVANLFGKTTSADARSWWSRPPVILFSIYLPIAMVTVQLGQRFFAHYFQLMLPAVAACAGLAAFGFVRELRDRAVWRVTALVLVGVILIDRFFALRFDALWSGTFHWPAGALVLLLVAGCLAVVAYVIQQPLRRAGAAVAALIALQAGVLVLGEQLAPAPVSMQHNRYKFVELTHYLGQRSSPGDRLFVWGWAPEIYSLTRLEAASHITFCQYVANDLKGVPQRPRLNEEWAGLLMTELRETPPRFIVDAARRSWYETESTIYDLANFPSFELLAFLQEGYTESATVDGCPVWIRDD